MRGGPPWGHGLEGRLDELELESPALVGNTLGDPSRRPILVQLPPGYDPEGPRRYRALYALQGFGGMLADWDHRRAFQATTPELVDRALSSGAAPDCVVVYVDAWTRLGGSQFLDSPGTGRYQDYLAEDVVGFVDAHYRTVPDRDHRGVLGLSSGGFGAVHAALSRPEVFGGFASHAGDAAFELSLLPDLSAAYRTLRDRYDRSFAGWQAERERPGWTPRPDEHALLMVHALSACYSPDDQGAPLLPFELADGRLEPAVWERWLALDPVRLVRRRGPALASMRGIWVDAGRADDYRLDLGAEQLVAAMSEAGATEVAFELFEGTHSGLAARYPLSVAYLASRLAP